jgi:mono/diheme cytochrome c family protein
MLIDDHWGRIMSLFILGALVALMAAQYVGVGQGSPGPIIQLDPSLVDKGREAFGQACVQCHGINRATIQRKSEEGWRGTVYSMISRGSPLMPDEIEPVIAYLTATYGPEAAPPGSEEGASSGSGGLPDEPGREILVRSCVQCHAMEMVLEAKKTENEWKQTVARMASYGANVSPEEQDLVVKYAVAHFGTR